MIPSQRCISLIEEFEGCKLSPYQDSAGIWTIGMGTTYYPNGCAVSQEDEPITKEQAEKFLLDYLDEICKRIEHHVTYPINQNQFDALLSFSYNCGIGSLEVSTLLKKLNAGDIDGAAKEFYRWDRAGGEENDGLLRRRTAEAQLFLEA